MIILITGASHTGKTALAQKLLEKYKYPYLSIDHLKMGLTRSRNTELTPMSGDSDLTEYLWPIVCEIVKTAIENKQNLIVEGCYIPFDWKTHFTDLYLAHIRYYCLVLSESYIKNHFSDIKKYANVIEYRLSDEYCTMENLLQENAQVLELAKKHDENYILIDEDYKIDIAVENVWGCAKQMKTVTICGSMKFSKEMTRIAFELETIKGYNVLQCTYNDLNIETTPQMLENLKQSHFCKIDMSDMIYVVDVNGYIGDSVRQEIEYAQKQHKEIVFYSQTIMDKKI